MKMRNSGFKYSKGEPGWIQEKLSNKVELIGMVGKSSLGPWIILIHEVACAAKEGHGTLLSQDTGATYYQGCKELSGSLCETQTKPSLKLWSGLGSAFAAAQTSPNLLAKVGTGTLEGVRFPSCSANGGSLSFILMSFTMSWLN